MRKESHTNERNFVGQEQKGKGLCPVYREAEYKADRWWQKATNIQNVCEQVFWKAVLYFCTYQHWDKFAINGILSEKKVQQPLSRNYILTRSFSKNKIQTTAFPFLIEIIISNSILEMK